jgi:hypothetical protein
MRRAGERLAMIEEINGSLDEEGIDYPMGED